MIDSDVDYDSYSASLSPNDLRVITGSVCSHDLRIFKAVGIDLSQLLLTFYTALAENKCRRALSLQNIERK